MSLELEEYKPQKAKEAHKPIRSKTLEETIDLGFCPVKTTTTKTFDMFNPNPYPVDYSFESDLIIITPQTGQIQSKNKVSITLSFMPNEALAVTSQIVLKITEEEPRTIKVMASGKYPYISLNTQQLQFEDLLVNKQITKTIEIKNSSQVTARFNIYKIQDDEFKDNSFEINIHQGQIEPKDSQLISVTYKPQVANLISVAHYKIQCQGGNDLVFECSGYSTGFQVRLNTNSINFGEVKIEKETSRLLTIHNDSDLPVLFEFYNDTNNIFGFSRTRGQINPKTHERIIVHFRPKHTICYYERVYCIVRNHSLLSVDLIGTCYDLLIQPIPLLQKHIDAFRRRVVYGKLSEIDFKYMENAMLLKASQTLSPSKKLDASTVSVNQTQNPNQNQLMNPKDSQKQNTMGNSSIYLPPLPPDNQIVLHKELFQNPNSNNKLIVLSEEFLDFGFCEYRGVPIQKELIVSNKMPCKITIFWTIQNHESIDEKMLPVFNVHPETASLKPNSQMTFNVSFRPVKSNYYFFQQLQFFAFKYSAKLTKKIIEDAQKNQSKTLDNTFINDMKQGSTNLTSRKTEQLTADETIPPYNSLIRCVGHSFGDGSQPYIPILKLHPSEQVYFAACSREESLYQTVELHNLSDTPSYYKFSPDTTKTFRVFPNCGLVESKGFVILTIEFNPKEFKAYDQFLHCFANHNVTNSLKIHVHGYCSEPNIQLQNGGKVYFPPSYTGVCSRQKVKIQNISRIPLQYNISIPKKYAEELYLNPASGNIKPNETLFFETSFIPYRKKNYKIKVNMEVQEILDGQQNLIGYHLPGSGNPDKPLRPRQPKSTSYTFEIFGQGGDGSLEIESSEKTKTINFGIVKVNFNQKKYAILHNFSQCTFYIELKLRGVTGVVGDEDEWDEYVRKNFTLDFEQGIIAANSTIDVGIMFNPTEVGDHNLVLEVIAKEKNPMVQTETKWTQKLLVQKCSLKIKGTGSYPLLKIADVRNDAVSVATLWENFQINRINDELAKDLNEDEKTFLNIETLNYTDAQHLQRRLKSYDWNFGYLPSKSNIKPRKIVITIENIGGTECDWQFKLPSDNQIDVEPWADPGEPTPEDAFEKAIIERQIFQIQPKQGTLQPGQLKDVELIYSPGNVDESLMMVKKMKKMQEEHFLRVVLQIMNGKPLVINLKGMTLSPSEGRLAVKKTHYQLPDTPIGLLIPVKFPIEIQNVGSLKINYKIEIQEEDAQGNPINSKFKIFEIQNPNGQLLTNERQYLYCQFKPLETKCYYHKLKIFVYDFMDIIQTIQLHIEGRGYSKAPSLRSKMNQEVIPKQRSFVSTIGSKVFFSIEEIDFGVLMPKKSAHRLIILYNLSKQNKLNFDFSSTNIAISSTSGLTCGDTFEINPSSGSIEPEKFIELKLTLTASTEPSVYEGEMECSITWDQRDEDKEMKVKQASNLSQPSSSLNLERETLFLRIKKKSSFDVELINSFKETTQLFPHKDKHCFEIIMESVFNDILNDSNTYSVLKRIDRQPLMLAGMFDGEEPANLDKVQSGLIEENKKVYSQRNYKDYRQLFLEDEFVSLVDEIMENTFFNIISETTREECDLLRISKTFVMPNK